MEYGGGRFAVSRPQVETPPGTLEDATKGPCLEPGDDNDQVWYGAAPPLPPDLQPQIFFSDLCPTKLETNRSDFPLWFANFENRFVSEY
jgi:hypothetical protein